MEDKRESFEDKQDNNQTRSDCICQSIGITNTRFQLKGNPSKQCYRYATIFFDQYSHLSYVFLQQTIMSDEMVQAKIAFEQYSEERGVPILHYNADNG